MEQRHRIVIAVVLLASLLGGAALIWLSTRGKPDSEASQTAPAEPASRLAWLSGPQPWERRDGARSAFLRSTPGGPALEVSPTEVVVLTPIPADATDVQWEVDESGDFVVFEGRGTLRGRPLTMTWRFASGNPQAAFHLRVEGLPADALTVPIVGHVDLPAGDVRSLDRSMRRVPFAGTEIRLGPWTPGWLNWQGGGQHLSFGQWWADTVIVRALAENPGTRLEFQFWNPAGHAIGADCTPEATLDLESRMLATFGDMPIAFPSRFPSGARAVVNPIFISPHEHPDTRMREAAASDGADWARRARTIAFGHSSPADPRYGNGGLLGANLGGTLLVPSDFQKAPAVTKLAEDLRATTVEIGSSGEESLVNSDILRPPEVCTYLSDRDSWPVSVLIGSPTAHDGSYQNVLKSTPDDPSPPAPGVSRELPVAVHPLQLDGTRTHLVDQVLSRLYLDRLVAERGLLWFTTPLVATRNPLVAASEEALLIPERNGQWTIAPQLVRAFADIELMRETSRFHFTGIGRTVDHWMRTRRTEIFLSEDGVLEVTHPERPVREFTLVVGAAHRLAAENATIIGQESADAAESTQTWVWFDLDADETFRLSSEEPWAVDPVEWEVRGDVE